MELFEQREASSEAQTHTETLVEKLRAEVRATTTTYVRSAEEIAKAVRNCRRRRAPWQPSPTDPTEPTISARALAKARGTVEDFARSYMPLIGLPVDDVLCFADSLYFVAGSLYELDELNERGGDTTAALQELGLSGERLLAVLPTLALGADDCDEDLGVPVVFASGVA